MVTLDNATFFCKGHCIFTVTACFGVGLYLHLAEICDVGFHYFMGGSCVIEGLDQQVQRCVRVWIGAHDGSSRPAAYSAHGFTVFAAFAHNSSAKAIRG
jgi:hypothetical protein